VRDEQSVQRDEAHRVDEAGDRGERWCDRVDPQPLAPAGNESGSGMRPLGTALFS
jgi:hypothetical protein